MDVDIFTEYFDNWAKGFIDIKTFIIKFDVNDASKQNFACKNLAFPKH
jgi:hypothetical protein